MGVLSNETAQGSKNLNISSKMIVLEKSNKAFLEKHTVNKQSTNKHTVIKDTCQKSIDFVIRETLKFAPTTSE